MEEAVKIEFQRLWDESAHQDKRIELIEEDLKELKRIAISVEKLAIQMENMQKTQVKLTGAVEKIQAQPSEAWNNMQRTIFTAIISTVAGGLAVGLLHIINL